MGGCHSIFKRFANFAAVGLQLTPPGLVSDSLSGGIHVPFDGCDKTRKGILKAVMNYVAVATVNVVNTCGVDATAVQQVTVQCNPSFDALGSNVFESNYSCTTCMTNTFNANQGIINREKQVWEREGAVIKVRSSIDTQMNNLIDQLASCGVYTCKACALMDVTQQSMVQSVVECQNNTSFQAQFNTNMTSIIKQSLNENQDVMAAFASKFENPNVDTISQDIVSKINVALTSQFLTSVAQTLDSSQSLVFQGSNNTASGISQSNVFVVALREVSKYEDALSVTLNAYLEATESITESQNTLDDLGTTIFESTTTFADMLDNVVGKVMLAMLIGLGVILLGIIGFLIYRIIHKTVDVSEHLEAQIQARKIREGAFEDF